VLGEAVVLQTHIVVVAVVVATAVVAAVVVVVVVVAVVAAAGFVEFVVKGDAACTNQSHRQNQYWSLFAYIRDCEK